MRILDVNILPVPFIEMEYCPSSLVDLQKPVPPGEAIRILMEIVSGLTYAHREGYIHRDLKPGNILLCRDNVPKISDWGLSAAKNLCHAPTIIGFSLSYAAPEQVDAATFGEPDERTDIYGAGIILYELVTGTVPFGDGSVAEMCSRITRTIPPLPSSHDPALYPLDSVVMKCISKHPRERYQNPEELMQALLLCARQFEG